MKVKKLAALLILGIFLSSCQKEDDTYTSKDVKVDSVFDNINKENEAINVDTQKEGPNDQDKQDNKNNNENNNENNKDQAATNNPNNSQENLEKFVVVTTSNYRSEPNAEAENVIGTLNENTEVEKLEDVDSNGQAWTKIRFEGKEGYILSELIRKK